MTVLLNVLDTTFKNGYHIFRIPKISERKDYSNINPITEN